MCSVYCPEPVTNLRALVFHSSVYGLWEYLSPALPHCCPLPDILNQGAMQGMVLPGERYCLDCSCGAPASLLEQHHPNSTEDGLSLPGPGTYVHCELTRIAYVETSRKWLCGL